MCIRDSGYALNILAINISAEMASFVDNKALFTVFCRFVGKNASEQSAAYDKIVILFHNFSSVSYTHLDVYKRQELVLWKKI